MSITPAQIQAYLLQPKSITMKMMMMRGVNFKGKKGNLTLCKIKFRKLVILNCMHFKGFGVLLHKKSSEMNFPGLLIKRYQFSRFVTDVLDTVCDQGIGYFEIIFFKKLR